MLYLVGKRMITPPGRKQSKEENQRFVSPKNDKKIKSPAELISFLHKWNLKKDILNEIQRAFNLFFSRIKAILNSWAGVYVDDNHGFSEELMERKIRKCESSRTILFVISYPDPKWLDFQLQTSGFYPLLSRVTFRLFSFFFVAHRSPSWD